MRAVRVTDGEVSVVDVAAKSEPGVHVRVASAGICGSDLHLLGPDSPMQISVTLGHEVSGYTDDGTPVAIEPLAPCEDCDACARGEYNLCTPAEGLLFGISKDGGMAESMWVPERCLVPLPAGLEVRDASLVEPLAVLVHSFRRSDLRADQRVAVVGGGTIGLSAVAVARGAHALLGTAAELAHGDDERFVEHAAIVEV